MNSLSVVIAAKNCKDRLEGTVVPWKYVAAEIIVVDQLSADGTAEEARRLGCRVLEREPPGGNFDLNRKFGMSMAKGDWILYVDTDERPNSPLLEEIRTFLAKPPADVNGVRVPNEFYFLGKPLRHGIFNPRTAAEIRLVRRETWDYPCEDGFHRGVSVQGKTIRLKNSYRHFNVNTISEWFIKTNQYTEHDAIKNWHSRSPRTYGAFFDAFRFFVRHYFWKRGFLDGFRGLVSVFYFMLYHLTLQVKIWEKRELDSLKQGEDYLDPISSPKR